MRFFSFIILLLVASSSVFAEKIKLNLSDISVLFPLPEPKEFDLLPHPLDKTAQGELLPRTYVVEHMPTLLQFTPNAELFTSLRAVGFRVDPCFIEGRGPKACKRQIRFVWQPLKEVEGKITTVDVALHSFYGLNENEFSQLINDLRNLKKLHSETDQTAGVALSVNPILAAEGLQSSYYLNLKKIIYQNIGRNNLSRITFMQLFANETVWFFGGLDIDADNSVKKISIPRINQTLQQFINSAPPARASTSFLGRIFPTPSDQEDNINILLSDSKILDGRSEKEIIDSVRSAFKMENPNLHNPGTLDCVSCHAAQPAKVWSLNNFSQFNFGDLSTIQYNPSPTGQNLSNVSPLRNLTNVVRIFGYFDDRPIVTDRAINETNEAVSTIEKNY